MTVLIPCPFCGSKNIDPEGWSGTATAADPARGPLISQMQSGPACDDCGATAESIEKWNTRAQPSTNDIGIIAVGLGLFASCIKSGESWSDRCEQVKTDAYDALRRVAQGGRQTPEKPLRDILAENMPTFGFYTDRRTPSQNELLASADAMIEAANKAGYDFPTGKEKR